MIWVLCAGLTKWAWSLQRSDLSCNMIDDNDQCGGDEAPVDSATSGFSLVRYY